MSDDGNCLMDRDVTKTLYREVMENVLAASFMIRLSFIHEMLELE